MTAVLAESSTMVSTWVTFDIIYETTVSLELNKKTDLSKNWKLEEYKIDDYLISKYGTDYKYQFRLDDQMLLKHKCVTKSCKMTHVCTSERSKGREKWEGREEEVYEHNEKIGGVKRQCRENVNIQLSEKT